MGDLVFEISRAFGILSEGTRGWQKELNLVSWNQRAPKFDIRDWGPDHEKMGKGVTLNIEELKKLKQLLEQIDLEEFI